MMEGTLPMIVRAKQGPVTSVVARSVNGFPVFPKAPNTL